MGRLFWKIFFAFWIAMLLIAAGAALATSHLAAAWHERAVERRERLDVLAEDADAVLASAGSAGLADWLREVEQRDGPHIFLLDPSGDDLLGRELPEVLRRARNSRWMRGGRDHPPGRGAGAGPGPEHRPREFGGEPPSGRPGFDRGPIAVRFLTAPSGERFRLVADLGLRSRDILHSRMAILVRAGVAILLSGVVAFLLSRYLISPLQALRDTTVKFKEGDLDARVGPALGRRRDEFTDLGRDIDEMAERIGRMLTSQRRLLRDLSHELRSPLARLQVALELARKRAGDSAQSDLQRIELESERLNEMIGQILALVRLESSPHQLERESVDLHDLLASVVTDADYEARASDKKVVLRTSGAVTGSVNEEVLRRAVENIVRNAVRHTPQGTTVDVALSKEPDDTLSITVRDHGPGVPESSLSHLFEPFYRDAEARGLDPTGHGLGLAIAKRAVDVHGGRILAENHRDGGLRVEIRI